MFAHVARAAPPPAEDRAPRRPPDPPAGHRAPTDSEPATNTDRGSADQGGRARPPRLQPPRRANQGRRRSATPTTGPAR